MSLFPEQRREIAFNRDSKICHNCGILEPQNFCLYCIETAEARGSVRRLRHIECSPFCDGHEKTIAVAD